MRIKQEKRKKKSYTKMQVNLEVERSYRENEMLWPGFSPHLILILPIKYIFKLFTSGRARRANHQSCKQWPGEGWRGNIQAPGHNWTWQLPITMNTGPQSPTEREVENPERSRKKLLHSPGARRQRERRLAEGSCWVPVLGRKQQGDGATKWEAVPGESRGYSPAETEDVFAACTQLGECYENKTWYEPLITPSFLLSLFSLSDSTVNLPSVGNSLLQELQQ